VGRAPIDNPTTPSSDERCPAAPATPQRGIALPERLSMDDALQQTWNTVATFVPKLIAFLLILIIGWIIARVLAKAINAILERVGFDRAVERGGVKKALEKSKYDASDVVAKLVYYALVLFVLQAAFGVFGPNPISTLLTQVITFLPSLVVAIIIVVVAAAIATAARELISNTLGGLSYGKLLGTIAGVFILGLGIIAALNQIGVATTVTTPILIAVLATVAGTIIVGVGGGMIKPMQARTERWLSKAETESQAFSSSTAYQAGQRAADTQVIVPESVTEPTQSIPPTTRGY
jgi:MFS family permease